MTIVRPLVASMLVAILALGAEMSSLTGSTSAAPATAIIAAGSLGGGEVPPPPQPNV